MKNKNHRRLNFFGLLLFLTFGVTDKTAACPPCAPEDQKFYGTLNEHLQIVSRVISNGLVDENGYYAATEKQMNENIAAIENLKNGHFFYFSSSEQQRLVFKKCQFSLIYSLFQDFGKELDDIKSCSSDSCDKKTSQDIAGVIVKMLKTETAMCKSELKDKTQ